MKRIEKKRLRKPLITQNFYNPSIQSEKNGFNDSFKAKVLLALIPTLAVAGVSFIGVGKLESAQIRKIDSEINMDNLEIYRSIMNETDDTRKLAMINYLIETAPEPSNVLLDHKNRILSSLAQMNSELNRLTAQIQTEFTPTNTLSFEQIDTLRMEYNKIISESNKLDPFNTIPDFESTFTVKEYPEILKGYNDYLKEKEDLGDQLSRFDKDQLLSLFSDYNREEDKEIVENLSILSKEEEQDPTHSETVEPLYRNAVPVLDRTELLKQQLDQYSLEELRRMQEKLNTDRP